MDPQLVKLARVVQNGWGESHGELDADLHAFWIHRFNMHIANGIIMNGSRIVIPKSLQQEYLQCLHIGHLGISKCRAMEWSFVHKMSSPHYPKGNAHAERAVGIVKEVYTKCKDNFLLVLLVHHTTPLLYMKSKLNPAELFFGHRLASNLPIIHSSNPELVAEQQPLDDSSRTRNVNFEPGDSVWVCLSPIENSWKQGIIIRSVVGVPDSFVTEINGQQY